MDLVERSTVGGREVVILFLRPAVPAGGTGAPRLLRGVKEIDIEGSSYRLSGESEIYKPLAHINDKRQELPFPRWRARARTSPLAMDTLWSFVDIIPSNKIEIISPQ